MHVVNSFPHYNLCGKFRSVGATDFLKVEAISKIKCKIKSKINTSNLDNLVRVLHIEEGGLKGTLGSESLTLKSPSLVLIPSTTAYELEIQPNAKGQILTIPESFLMQVIVDANQKDFSQILQTPFVLKLSNDNEAHQEISNSIWTVGHELQWTKSGWLQLVSAYLKILIINLYRISSVQGKCIQEDSPTPVKYTGNSKKAFTYFLELVEENYKNHWSVQQYAKCLDMTENRLNRLCRKIANLSPSQIIHNQLVTEAKHRLVYTANPVSVIAYDLGFKDPAYFSRYFNNQTGGSASQFRDTYAN